MLESFVNATQVIAAAGLATAVAVLASPATSGEAPVLGHEVFGSGAQKVMVLHDWMGDAANYQPLKAYLDGGAFTFVFADLRGYGRSKALKGDYTVEEIAGDTLALADALGWGRFHVVGHSMSGMAVQRLAIDDWTSGARRLKSVVAVTPVTADGYPATKEDREFLWSAIHNEEVSRMAFDALTGGRLGAVWARVKTARNLETSDAEALKGYYKMWLDADFSADAIEAGMETPIRVIGGRNDLPGFLEEKYRATFALWYPRAEFRFISDAGHYPMQETPAYLAALIQEFLTLHSTP
jgi:pimeloyl-ACP methyl ester carboxylesterase